MSQKTFQLFRFEEESYKKKEKMFVFTFARGSPSLLYLKKKRTQKRTSNARREREREKSRVCLFEKRASRSRDARREGCIIKFIHSGLPNRSILIRDRFRASATRKELAFSSISRRCKFLSTPSPPS